MDKKIEQILKDHEIRIRKLENPVANPSQKVKNNKKSITDLLVEIKEEGFFNRPKSHKEILDKLEEMGHIYEGKSIDSPLVRALHSRILGRKKIDGKWMYVKR